MSGAQDKFEDVITLYYERIRRFLLLKVDVQTAEDLTQLTFIKALENYDSFRGNSSLFTWLSSIANNTLKNEYRKKHRTNEVFFDIKHFENHFISVEFTKNVEIRIDITKALEQLNDIDREIISLHYDVGCTLQEVSEIVGKQLSTVKNRLYRALGKLRKEFINDWEVRSFMSIIENILVVNKEVITDPAKNDKKVHQDIIDHLKMNVDRICALLQHEPLKKITIEVYPDLPSFHQAVHEPDAPNWFMGVTEGNVLKIASPLNPGPEHTYESILKSTIHLFTMWIMKDINPAVPKWICQGLGGYEADLMTKDYIRDSLSELVAQAKIPSFENLEDNTWNFDTMKGFQFSYTLAEFVILRYGNNVLNTFIRNPLDFEGAFHCSAAKFHEQWSQELTAKYH